MSDEEPADDAGSHEEPTDDGQDDAGAPGDGAAKVGAGDFEEDRRQAVEMLDDEDVDGFYAGIVRDDELDYVFSHRFDEPEEVGRQALSLLAHHVSVIADQADLDPAQVADDAARLAAQLGDDQR